MAGRKAAHTHVDRAVTRPSNVTSESKTDTNAGSTAASGCGNSVHDEVCHVEVAVSPGTRSDLRERAIRNRAGARSRRRSYREKP